MPRGRKPKPPVVRQIDGTHRSVKGRSQRVPGHLRKPPGLPADAAAIWDAVAPDLHWLGRLDSQTLAVWCALQAQFIESPRTMPAARLAQLRAYGIELGITPSSRTRMDVSHEPKEPQSKYFHD